MASYLGIDTSNYTTSCALYHRGAGKVVHSKQLLPVQDGALGLRQSDALFSHVKQLGGLMEQLFSGEEGEPVRAVGVSARPRDGEGSYMPCFLAGEMAARSVGAALGVPVHLFSHQAGHVMAALYSTGRLDLVGKEFLAFHLSGGTTDCLWVRPDRERVFSITLLASSLDLKAGQAVDRVGGMLGLPFPAGPQLDKLAAGSQAVCRQKPAFKGENCCLSGIQNICEGLWKKGTPAADVARICLDYLCKALEQMTENALAAHPGLPLIYCGGVMSNSLIRQRIQQRFGGQFAEPQFSSDNASGPAILASVKEEMA